MRILKKAIFVPIYLLACVLNIAAGIANQFFSLVSGIFLLLMIAGAVVTIMNQAWNQLLILIAITILGFGILFGVVAIKVAIEEFKDFCYRKVF